jgi:protein-disulfide isomerase
MDKKVLAVAGGCAALLVVCVICVGLLVVLGVSGKIDQALSTVQGIQPGQQAFGSARPTLGAVPVQPASTRAPTVNGIAAVGRTKGDPKAPIAFVDYSDFQWPYCREFALGAERQIEEAYVNTGKVSITFKYFPVIDQGDIGESHWAAQAAECANQQGKFWEYHDKLFAVWVGEDVGTYTKPNLEKYAASLKLDTASFNKCLETDATLAIVQADEDQAANLDLQGTPSFLINGRILDIQSLDFSEFSQAFDSLIR